MPLIGLFSRLIGLCPSQARIKEMDFHGESNQLETVGISNGKDEENFIAADISFFSIISLKILFPILFIFFFSIGISLYTFKENLEEIRTVFGKTDENKYVTTNNTIFGISPMHRYIKVMFSLTSDYHISFYNGSAAITFFKDSKIVGFSTKELFSNDISVPQEIIVMDNIYFDSILLLINFSTMSFNGQEYIISVYSLDSSCSFNLLLSRIIFSLILLPIVIYHCIDFLDPNVPNLGFYLNITFALSLFTVAADYPIYFIKTIFPSEYHDAFTALLRDTYLAYLIFYMLSLYIHFGRSSDNYSLFIGFPIAVMLFSFGCYIFADFKKFFLRTGIDSALTINANFNYTSIHVIVLFINLVILITRSFYANRHLNQGQKQRWITFTIMNISTLSFIFLLSVNDCFHQNSLNYVIKDLLPLAVFTFYAFFMENSHKTTDENLQIYTSQTDDDNEPNDLGIEINDEKKISKE